LKGRQNNEGTQGRKTPGNWRREARISVDLAKLLTEEGHVVVEVERTRPGVWKLDVQKGER